MISSHICDYPMPLMRSQMLAFARFTDNNLYVFFHHWHRETIDFIFYQNDLKSRLLSPQNTASVTELRGSGWTLSLCIINTHFLVLQCI